ncbi:MAG: DUF3417 domain-containing protein, partial [Rhodospirillales bacterium]|nr:DUF3417 domain-containing protein [Rhodospirillales bacterium]
SMAQLTPRFSTNRAVREYTEQHYLPAAVTYHERVANKGAVGSKIVDWEHTVKEKWAALRFGEVKFETRGNQHVCEVQVYFNDFDPKAACVELYADGVNGGSPVRQGMKLLRPLDNATGGFVYGTGVSAERPASDYTARIIPSCNGAVIPLENAHILWQH